MRHTPTAVTAATVALALVTWAAPAGAVQLDAHDDPKVSDNMTLGGKKCATERDKNEGEVVAVIHSCQRFYVLDPSSEDDPDRDYGAFWLQSTIAPRAGWCATKVASDMVFPSSSKVISRAPSASATIDEAHRLRTKLTIGAHGHAQTPGSISQASRAYPDDLTPLLSRDADKGTTRFRLLWTGSNSHVLALVSGVQLSWSVDAGPPKTTRFGLRKYTLQQKDSC